MKYQPGSTVEWNFQPPRRTPPPYLIMVIIFAAGLAAGLAYTREDKTEIKTVMPDNLPPDEPPISDEAASRVNMAVIELNQENKPAPPPKAKAPQNAAKPRYSQFEIAMWYLKAHESFRPHEYDDGAYPSKGFGLNLTPGHVKWASEVLGFPARSRDWTYQEGQKVLRAYWQKKRDKFLADNKHLKPHQQTALLLHAYNTGKYTNIRGCCGAKVGCGRKGDGRNARIRTAHNKRRQFEWRLYNNEVTNAEIEVIRQKAIEVEVKWGKHGTR